MRLLRGELDVRYRSVLLDVRRVLVTTPVSRFVRPGGRGRSGVLEHRGSSVGSHRGRKGGGRGLEGGREEGRIELEFLQICTATQMKTFSTSISLFEHHRDTRFSRRLHFTMKSENEIIFSEPEGEKGRLAV